MSAALIVAGVAMIAVGVIRPGDESGTSSRTTASGATSVSQLPDALSGAPLPGEDAGELQRQTYGDRFSIGVPARWSDDVRVARVVLTAAGGSATVRIFFDPGEHTLAQLARSVAAFLASHQVGALVGPPEEVQIDGERALQVRAASPAGEDIAVVLTDRGFSYVIVRRVDADAQVPVAAEANAVVQSFRPR